MAKLQEVLTSPASWAVLGAALLLPFAWPLLALLLPVAAFALVTNGLSNNRGSANVGAQVAAPTKAQPSKLDPEFTTSIVVPVNTNGPASPGKQAPGAVGKLPRPGDGAGDRIGTAPAAGGAAILAKLKAQREAKASPGAKPAAKEVVVVYGSQTGTAQEIARGIQAEAESQGLKAKVASMNEFGFENLSADKSPLVVLVSSSTGDGDPPDNAAKFYMALRRRSNDDSMLQGIQYTCLGLGDSNYTRFCHVPRTLRNRFQELGAKEFYPSGECDEVDGLETAVDLWLDGFWPALKRATKAAFGGAPSGTDVEELKGVPALPKCRVRVVMHENNMKAEAVRKKEAQGPTNEELGWRDPSGMYSAEQPFWAPVSDAKYLTTEDSEDRKVLHLELDVSGSGMAYQPGDSIGVLPQNSDAMVDGLLLRLGLDGDAVFSVAGVDGSNGVQLLPHLKCPCTVRAALKRGCDLTSVPRKSLLRLLAEHCTDAKEKYRLMLLCSKDGREAYTKEVLEGRPTLLDLLEEFPSCKVELGPLLDALPALPARMYSVACSPLELPKKVQMAFTVVHYETKYGAKDGVATGWLEKLVQPITSGEESAGFAGLRVPIFLRSGGDFKPPETLEAPVVMIGPGTGVAPFRGFLQHRKAQLAGGDSNAAGEAWLFFGCRRDDQDYLYGEDWTAFQVQGVLSKFFVAFSRAQEQKLYVQHLMKEHSADLFDLLVNREAYVFVCGDGMNMAKDVQACLTGIIREGGGLSEGEAAEVLAEMARQKRYVRDIWS